MLDDRSTLRARDPERFLDRLAALPDAYAGPDGVRPAPHGFGAAGAAAVLEPVVADWFDGRLTPRGTQFFVEDGFEDPDELAVRRSAVEAAGAEVVVIGVQDEDVDAGSHAFARVGKALAIPAGAHGALVAAAAFESRPALADDLVALLLGRLGPETELIEEVLTTRVAQVGRLAFGAGGLPAADADPVVDALVLWYAATWVAAYGAILAEIDPADDGVYGRVRAVA